MQIDGLFFGALTEYLHSAGCCNVFQKGAASLVSTLSPGRRAEWQLSRMAEKVASFRRWISGAPTFWPSTWRHPGLEPMNGLLLARAAAIIAHCPVSSRCPFCSVRHSALLCLFRPDSKSPTSRHLSRDLSIQVARPDSQLEAQSPFIERHSIASSPPVSFRFFFCFVTPHAARTLRWPPVEGTRHGSSEDDDRLKSVNWSAGHWLSATDVSGDEAGDASRWRGGGKWWNGRRIFFFFSFCSSVGANRHQLVSVSISGSSGSSW